jgi:indolepyruvate ferredoxin oxidoreductase beta subunit
MRDRVTSIWISGVGGQGTILASELIALAALESGLDVKKSEVHGMAQRGGSVVSQVRFGPKVHSPLIAEGDADVLLAFEKVEALRYAPALKPTGFVVANTQEIPSSTVLAGLETYPKDVEARLRTMTERLVMVPGEQIARELGALKVVNVVLLGVASALIPLPPDSWEKAIRARLASKLVDLNLKAFARGRELFEAAVPAALRR